jgi:hypothetical protein
MAYLECTTALHVLLYIISLLEQLRYEKDLIFDPRMWPHIRILIPQIKNQSGDSFFCKRLDRQFASESLTMAQQRHHKKCNDLMLQFIADHTF